MQRNSSFSFIYDKLWLLYDVIFIRFTGSPMGMSFNMPPPPHSSTLPFNENVMQQMMMNSQYRSGNEFFRILNS